MTLRFAPRWYWVLLTAAVIPVFVSLGFWQWHRGQYRQGQWDAFVQADVPPVEANAAHLPQLPRFTRVRVRGELDGARAFLLDNVSHAGAPGFEVLGVLRLAEGSLLLVNRGWIPFSGYRDRLPDVSLPADLPPQVLTGKLSILPVAGIAAGRAPPPMAGAWPRLASFPSLDELQRSYGAPLLPVVLLLDADSGPGYLRDWQPSGIPPERNFGYAVQWWSFAVLALALLIGLNLKKRK
ncbi:MAG: SURF1 family protein [Steroidobacteraceae bacterium]